MKFLVFLRPFSFIRSKKKKHRLFLKAWRIHPTGLSLAKWEMYSLYKKCQIKLSSRTDSLLTFKPGKILEGFKFFEK